MIKPVGGERVQAYQVRVLDAGKYEATQQLQQNCATLTSKIDQLSGLVKTYLEVLDKQASQMMMRQHPTSIMTAGSRFICTG